MEFIFSYIAKFSIYEWIMGAFLLFFFLILLCYNLTVYRKPYKYEMKREEISVDDSNLPGISVIISSKNDSVQLEKNLPFILEQCLYQLILLLYLLVLHHCSRGLQQRQPG
jgi:cellulose synthase/poly-beta-1,6-N-acetylglucosamine synthase-like glycosyltransferase